MVRKAIENIDNLAIAFSKTIAKSEELAGLYNENVKTMGTLTTKIKNDQKALWIPDWVWKLVKTWVIGSVSFVTIALFFFKMWQVGMLPDFKGPALKIIGHLIHPTTQVVIPDIQNILKPDITSTLKTIAETPIASLTLIAGVGAFTISLGIIKVILFIVQRAPK